MTSNSVLRGDNVSTAGAEFGDEDPCIAYNRVFFALLRIDRSIMPAIEKVLREAGIADPIWYEILLATEEAGADGIRMITLQRRLFVAQYALSRHVARLEKAGLIRREASAGSGRGQILHLTEAARGLHERVWTVYHEAIRNALAPRISTDEAYALVRMLNRLYT
ncbi:MarR family winged helix-turn-helix transcriptional regulator [Rhodovulum strictum]|uniref:MarR family transcriptional regulator n=1 Tax=Rhodovulum strictum TaxID=58314 RepID=A0A844BJH5_9RHOB|nr:MarR family transcriptional regulator [Rhodovulum strictum]MRH22699.1 MarR family transcriptional regulator [Rhodovulum strictum]